MRASFLNLAVSGCLVLGLSAGLTACGGGGGDAVQAQSQRIELAAAAPATMQPLASLSLRATATSGLSVSYRSLSPSVCTVNAASGLVTAVAQGQCVVQLAQAGDERHAPASTVTVRIDVFNDPAQIIVFDAAPTLTVGGTATVVARASSGMAVSYSSLSPAVCTVNAGTGLLTSLGTGTCTVAADQAGDAYYEPAAQVTQTLMVQVPSGVTVPGVPAGVASRAGDAGNTVVVTATSVDSGGSALTGYRIRSLPAGVDTTVSSLPATVNCPSACAGHAFTLAALNAVGEGSASGAVDIITRYNVVLTFHEPDTQPRDSIFRGSFVFNATDAVVTELRGLLTESMTGSASSPNPDYDMVQLSLTHQLSSVTDSTLGGLLVTTFLNSNTNTFWTGGGGDGWSPERGVAAGGVYHGFPVAANNPGNAYVRIFVNPVNPLTPLTQAQIDKLAYADCAPGGMMGAVCMTGTTVAGYGAIGTMSGYPVSQVITRAP